MAEPPAWIVELADAITPHIYGEDCLAPLGCHFHHHQGVWEISLFVSSTEIVGGPLDGARQPSRFRADLKGALTVFDYIDRFHWQAQSLGDDDDLGAHVTLEGQFRGHYVWLRLLASAPAQYQPGRFAHVYTDVWEETW